MKVFWAAAAQDDRAEILDYISQDNPLAAIRMDELFSHAAARLAQHPLLGRTGQIAGTRELMPHESYRLGVRSGRRCRVDSGARAHSQTVATSALGATMRRHP
jgi:plasmid stabilization system protein ParE